MKKQQEEFMKMNMRSLRLSLHEEGNEGMKDMRELCEISAEHLGDDVKVIAWKKKWKPAKAGKG